MGALNPVEFKDLRSTPDVLSKLVNTTGGGIHWIDKELPSLRKVKPDRDFSGQGWIGLIDNKAYIVTGLVETSLIPPLWSLIGILTILITTWWREGH